MGGEDANEEKDNPDTVESVWMSEVFSELWLMEPIEADLSGILQKELSPLTDLVGVKDDWVEGSGCLFPHCLAPVVSFTIAVRRLIGLYKRMGNITITKKL